MTTAATDRGDDKPGLKERLFGGGDRDDDGVIREEVHRERDRGTEMRHEEVTNRRFDN